MDSGKTKTVPTYRVTNKMFPLCFVKVSIVFPIVFLNDTTERSGDLIDNLIKYLGRVLGG